MRTTSWLFLLAGGAAIAGAAYLGAARYIDSVEHPAYEIVESDGPIEIRRYGPMIVAEIDARGARREASSAAFSPLASYIFAKERPGEAIAMTAPVTQAPRDPIAMTAPVTQTQGDAPDAWTVRFVMPASYTLESLPTPENAEVRLIELPSTLRAAVRFGGVATDDSVAEAERRLLDWATARGLAPVGPPTYAYYNSPFTPGFMRRNEVMIELADG